MKNFFKTIPQTVWSPAFYRELLAAPSLLHTFGYFIGLVAIISIIAGLVGSASLLKLADKMNVREIVESGVAKYPADYIFEVKGGMASSSRAEPVALTSVDFGLPNDVCMEAPAPCLLLSIDTSRNPSIEEVLASGSRIWVGKNFVYSVDGHGTVEAQNLATYNDFTMTKARAQELAGYLNTFLDGAYPYLALIFAIFAFISLGFYLIAALLVALVLLALGRWKGWSHSYKALFVASVHAATLPIVLSTFAVLVTLPLPGILAVLIMLALAFGNINAASKDEMVVTPVDETSGPSQSI